MIDYMRDLSSEVKGGLLLILATFVALILANSSLSHAYHDILNGHFIIGNPDGFSIDLSVEHWINDGLMVIFFLVVGMEIKREFVVGEFKNLKNATTPLIAAAGGMLIPALIYVLVNHDTPYEHGWGIPMATDIAYSLGVLGLLGRRVPPQLKIFLVALAVADDLGAILVIAIFYSSSIAWMNLLYALIVFIALLLLNRYGVKKSYPYIIGGVALWICFLYSGIHPTIAGVLFAISIPMQPKIDPLIFKRKAVEYVKALEREDKGGIESESSIGSAQQRKIMRAIRRESRLSSPPIIRFENALTGFNNYFILPVFAIANAGVLLDLSLFEIMTQKIAIGIFFGLLLGKSIGITLFAWISAKLKVGFLPVGLNWGHIVGTGFIAGIGFTMSLFITNLAFDDAEYVQIAKVSVLIASLASAIIGAILTVAAGKGKVYDEAEDLH